MGPEALLRDIRGLDTASWWPPAPGWWLLAALLLLAAFVIWRAVQMWRWRHGRWRRDAQRQLRRLRRGLRTAEPKQLAGELSELVRRIAMARCGRQHCAGLQGEIWLAWLKRNDPAGFDWLKHGRVLLDLPYAPDGYAAPPATWRRLLAATERWIFADAKQEPVAPDAQPSQAAAQATPQRRTGNADV